MSIWNTIIHCQSQKQMQIDFLFVWVRDVHSAYSDISFIYMSNSIHICTQLKLQTTAAKLERPKYDENVIGFVCLYSYSIIHSYSIFIHIFCSWAVYPVPEWTMQQFLVIVNLLWSTEEPFFSCLCAAHTVQRSRQISNSDIETVWFNGVEWTSPRNRKKTIRILLFYKVASNCVVRI